MALKVLLLGRPGSGKTTAAHYLLKLAGERDLSACHVDDYPLLEEKFQADQQQRRFRPLIVKGACCGFDVVDRSVLDEVLVEAEARVERHLALHPKDGLALLEFARDDYRRAFSQFRPGFLRDAAILYLRIDPTVSLQRVRERYQKTGYQLVSERVLLDYYGNDSFCSQVADLQKSFGIYRAIDICDNNGSWQALFRHLEQFFLLLLEREAGLIC